jgi:hypothetical protein
MSILGLFDYPKVICQVRDQLPSSERSSFIDAYKKLPEADKTSFKELLKKADPAAASKILGKDLTKYNIQSSQSASGKHDKGSMSQAQGTKKPQTGSITSTEKNDIITRVNKIISVPTNLDPKLVSDAAQRYEEAVPSKTSFKETI